MQDGLLVTGATGLIGANICRRAAAEGTKVRALVRRPDDAAPLAALGVEVVEGDITDRDSVRRGADGVRQVIHSAALLGGASQLQSDYDETNLEGTRNVLSAGFDAGIERMLVFSTRLVYDWLSRPFSEDAPIAVAGQIQDSPYSRSKRAAFQAAEAVRADGADILYVVPGAAFGPSPIIERSLASTSYNSHLLRAIRGEVAAYVDYVAPFVLADDVARVTLAALDHGTTGARYIAFGRDEDAMPVAEALTMAARTAGSDHTVRNVPAADVPAGTEADFGGPSIVELSRRGFPDPLFDSRRTRAELGVEPTGFAEALSITIDWFKEIGRL